MHKYSRFFNEIFTSLMVISGPAMMHYLPYIKAYLENNFVDIPEREPLKLMIYDNIGIIPIQGVLTLSGSWVDPGTEEIANVIQEAYDHSGVAAIVMPTHCYGGAVEAQFPMKEKLRKRNKPIISAVKGCSYSLGYLINALTDKIYCVDKMCSVGSVGIVASFTDDSKFWEEYKIKKITVYPPESDWKNLPQRKALEGDNSLLIKEELSPWAQYFQELVRENRPNLNEAIEGTLQGRTFFANYTDTNATMNGLIDGVMPMDEIIQYAFNLSTARKAKNFFNN